MIGIDLFAGAGGMSLGAVQAGIDVRVAIEIDPHAAKSYAQNHPKTEVLVADIRSIRKLPITRNGEPTIIFGGPPCQGFSTSNQRTRNGKNPDNWLFREYIRIVKLWKPDWIVFENVKGIAETEHGMFLNFVLEKLEAAGYRVCWWILNARDFGVPQSRQRLFVVGSLDGLAVEKPKSRVATLVTVKEAISDLPSLENGASLTWLAYNGSPCSAYAKRMRGRLKKSPNHLVSTNAPHILRRYKYVPQGGNWEDIPARLMRNYTDRSRCHTGIYYRLREDQPSLVIGNYRKNMLIHPTQDRGLSVREAARLQSFPDWYEFKGSLGFQQQQVGNAVPPLSAKKVFKTILSYS
ncbi:MAG: DNA cytosine methyltransferase [Planctomycetes bacterium]|nr:DNA cytosine methyltransferase [Planctomycetota bacterium]